MKLERVTIENYRASERLELPLHPRLTVLHGDNGHGKTSVLTAIAAGLSNYAYHAVDEMLGQSYNIIRHPFTDADRRKPGEIEVWLTSCAGESWVYRSASYRVGGVTGTAINQRIPSEIVGIMESDKDGQDPMRDLPIVAFYDTERAVVKLVKPDTPGQFGNLAPRYARYAALDGALAFKTDFQSFFAWFYERENEELREQREQRSFDYSRKDLDAVRGAIERMLPGVSRPRVEQVGVDRIRFLVSEASESGEARTVALDQMSGGYRIMLALVADLARRMAQGNPHLGDPLQSEAVVLIDEVDLHLHPSWQQRALPDLMRTFPNAQFIVSTHSPQVLTTVKPEHIVELYRAGDNVVAGGVSAPTFGAPAGDLLAGVMRVKERPPDNDFVVKLGEYMGLVGSGRGKTEAALELRRKLDGISPQDPGLDRADLEMRRQEVLKRIAASEPAEGD